MKIGDRMREARWRQGLTLEEVASQIGITRQTLSRYENSVLTNVPTDKIEAIAKATKTTPAYLMGWENELAQPQQPPQNTYVQDLFDELSIPSKKMILAALEGVYRAEKGESPYIPEKVKKELGIEI